MLTQNYQFVNSLRQAPFIRWLTQSTGGGSFHKRKEDASEIIIKDLASPCNFYTLFLKDDETVSV